MKGPKTDADMALNFVRQDDLSDDKLKGIPVIFISALTDQQLAAGVMWVPGSLAYTITFILGFYRWLEPDRTAGRAPAAFTT